MTSYFQRAHVCSNYYRNLAVIIFLLVGPAMHAQTSIYASMPCTTNNAYVAGDSNNVPNAGANYFGTLGNVHIVQGFSWTSTKAFTNVWISALLQAPWQPKHRTQPPLGGVIQTAPPLALFNAYLTNSQGKTILATKNLTLTQGGGLLPQIASYTDKVLFSNLSLPAGTYYVTLDSTSDFLLWQAQNVNIIGAHNDVPGISTQPGAENLGAGTGYPNPVASNPSASILTGGPGNNSDLCFSVTAQVAP